VNAGVPTDPARLAVVPPVADGVAPSEGSALRMAVRSLALVALAVLLVFVLLPALLSVAAPATLAAR
jgi:hypothetical protein